MKNISVISKRADNNTFSGIACGPVSMDVACAEMRIKDENTEKYLTLCWVSEAADSLEFVITEAPIFEYLLGDDLSDEGMDELDYRKNAGEDYLLDSAEDYEGRYGELLKDLSQFLISNMKEAGFLEEDTFKDQDAVWNWLTEIAGVTFDLPTCAEVEARIDEEYGENKPLVSSGKGNVLYQLSRKVVLDNGKEMYAAGMMLPNNIHLLAVRYYDNVIWFYVEHEDTIKLLNEKFPDIEAAMGYWDFVDTITSGNTGKRYLGMDQVQKSVYKDYFISLNDVIDAMR